MLQRSLPQVDLKCYFPRFASVCFVFSLLFMTDKLNDEVWMALLCLSK